MDLAAVAVTFRIWRESPMRLIHSKSALYGDGEVAVSNVRAWRVVRSHLDSELGLADPEGLVDELCDPDREVFPGVLMRELLHWSSSIVAPHDVKLGVGSLLRSELDCLEAAGVSDWLVRSAKFATLSLPGWFGSPWWGDVVAEVADALSQVQAGSLQWSSDEGDVRPGRRFWFSECGLPRRVVVPHPEDSTSGFSGLGVRQIDRDRFVEVAEKSPWDLRPFEALAFKVTPTAGLMGFRTWRHRRALVAAVLF